MASIDLSLLKKQVRADDFTDDDELLQFYLDAAEEWVADATNQADAIYDDDGALPKTLQQATLLLAAHWYNQREAVGSTMAEAPYTIQALIKPYRILVTSTSTDSDSE